jgi:hypothetical protein
MYCTDCAEAYQLDTSVTASFIEPLGSGTDESSHSYADLDYWNICVPGSATVVMYYWKPNDVTGRAKASYHEPWNGHQTYTYNSKAETLTAASPTEPAAGLAWSGYHGYMAYMAMAVNPGNEWGSYPGIPCWVCQTDKKYKTGATNFYAYPTLGAGQAGIRDALNWEISGHSSSWQNYFYAWVTTSSLTVDTFDYDLSSDIYIWAVPVSAAVNTAYLPNWSKSLSHQIAIVGYNHVFTPAGGINFSASTVSYIDTCGKSCGGGADGRQGVVRTISEQTMFNAIISNGGGFVW